MSYGSLDRVDQKIIEILSKNARTPSRKIADELKKMGYDMHDRSVRKRIARLEGTGVIKGYQALTEPTPEIKHRAILLKLKPSMSLKSVKKSILQTVSLDPQFLISAELKGDWDLLVVAINENDKTEGFSYVFEKHSGKIKNYSIVDFDFSSVNPVNLALILLKQ